MVNLMLIFILFSLVLIINALPILYTGGGILISGNNINDSIYMHVFLYIISFIITVSIMIIILTLMVLYYIKFIKNK